MALKSFRCWTWKSIRFVSIRSARFLSVCIVGSGPAGFYTADKLLKSHENVKIDIIDRLPTPFGLVRSGVAPDHPETKVVTNQFTRIAEDKRCSFFGNVTVGHSISLSELKELYDVVVLAYGAESDRLLEIPGEHLSGIHSAREFVWWYNGHPECANLNPNLFASQAAVILGQGNVALDAARILLRPKEELARTDIANHALDALKRSEIRKVYLVGRRGPAQAACTAKELRELLGITDLCIKVNNDDLLLSPKDEEELKKSRIHRRIYELLSKASSNEKKSEKELHFVFFRRPALFSSSESERVSSVCLEKTKLEGTAGQQIALGTGEYEELECGFVLKSIGYRSVSVEGIPFDHKKGVIPNEGGRVLRNKGSEKGVYVCGWLKRGPTGIIGTNLYCAEETVASINDDINNGIIVACPTRKAGGVGLARVLDERNVRYVPFSGWSKIDSEELRLGALQSKPREKIILLDDMLKIAVS